MMTEKESLRCIQHEQIEQDAGTNTTSVAGFNESEKRVELQAWVVLSVKAKSKIHSILSSPRVCFLRYQRLET